MGLMSVNARLGPGLFPQGGTSTGRTLTDNRDRGETAGSAA
jgi:hypothetical protein